MLTFEQIKELIELVSERRLQGLELERSGFRLKVDGQAVAQQVVYATQAPAAEMPLQAAAPAPAPMTLPAAGPPPAAASPAAAPEKAGPPAGSHVITSPFV